MSTVDRTPPPPPPSRPLERRYAELEIVHRLTAAVARATALDEIYAAALDGLAEALGVDRGSVLLFDPDDVLRFKAWRGLSDEYRQAVEGHTPWQPNSPEPEPIVVADATLDESIEPYREVILGEGIRALAFVPLANQGRVIGKFMLYYDQPHEFPVEELELALTIARQVAFAIERRRTEEALRASEEELLAIFDAAGSGHAVIDPQTGRFLRVNRQFCEITGYDPDELAARTISELTHPDDREWSLRDTSRMLSGEVPVYDVEKRYLRKDGTSIWVHITGTLAHDRSGRPTKAVGVVEDVTERRLAEAALRRSEERWRLLAESGAMLAASLERQETLDTIARLAVPAVADYCVVYLADAADRLRPAALAHADPEYETELAELVELYRPEESPESRLTHVYRTAESVLIDDLETDSETLSHLSIEVRDHVISLAPRSLIIVPLVARGRPLGALCLALIGSLYDSADLPFAEELGRRAALAIDNARLYQELKEAGRRKDEFLAMLAHELRNPLAAIVNAGEVLCQGDPATPVYRRAADVVGRQGQHMARMIEDLLDVSRVSRGKIALRYESVELVELVRRVAAEVADARPGAPPLDLQLPDRTVWMEADSARIIQVIDNLVSNALKFTPAGGKVSLALAVLDRPAGGEVVLTVADTGVGISPEFLPQIFDLFSQDDRSLDRASGGLGIGLTLARLLVELHGGAIAAESAGPGQGSVFTVRLPLGSPAVDAAAPAPAPPRRAPGSDRDGDDRSGARRILLVEDSEDSAVALAELLRLWGHEVRIAGDGPSALELAPAFAPDVILLDIGLPGMDGYEVARRLRRLPATRTSRFIALTGYGQERDQERSAAAGFDLHLIKPVDPKRLSALLEDDGAG